MPAEWGSHSRSPVPVRRRARPGQPLLPRPRPPRWRPGRLGVNLVTAAGLVGLMLLVSLTAPRWSGFFARPLPVAEEEPRSEEAPEAPVLMDPGPERQIQVKLLFEDRAAGGLVIEERGVPFASDLARQLELVVAEVLLGSQQGWLAPLPEGTRVLHVFVGQGGVAYVNLSAQATGQGDGEGGSRAELLSVFALVNSICANFPAVARVQLLVDGHPVETLHGHVDLSRPLSPDMSLLAPAELHVAPLDPGAAEHFR